jgi:hypothetical protein
MRDPFREAGGIQVVLPACRSRVRAAAASDRTRLLPGDRGGCHGLLPVGSGPSGISADGRGRERQGVTRSLAPDRIRARHRHLGGIRAPGGARVRRDGTRGRPPGSRGTGFGPAPRPPLLRGVGLALRRAASGERPPDLPRGAAARGRGTGRATNRRPDRPRPQWHEHPPRLAPAEGLVARPPRSRVRNRHRGIERGPAARRRRPIRADAVTWRG